MGICSKKKKFLELCIVKKEVCINYYLFFVIYSLLKDRNLVIDFLF